MKQFFRFVFAGLGLLMFIMFLTGYLADCPNSENCRKWPLGHWMGGGVLR